jgi:DNA-binding MarR family transcriptional regulator
MGWGSTAPAGPGPLRSTGSEQVSPPTITRLLVGMERDGLLKRERDREDGRVIWIRATPKGTRILQEGRRRRVAPLAGELEGFGR